MERRQSRASSLWAPKRRCFSPLWNVHSWGLVHKNSKNENAGNIIYFFSTLLLLSDNCNISLCLWDWESTAQPTGWLFHKMLIFNLNHVPFDSKMNQRCQPHPQNAWPGKHGSMKKKCSPFSKTSSNVWFGNKSETKGIKNSYVFFLLSLVSTSVQKLLRSGVCAQKDA